MYALKKREMYHSSERPVPCEEHHRLRPHLVGQLAQLLPDFLAGFVPAQAFPLARPAAAPTRFRG